MISIINKADCCGCNACGDVCAHKAITYETDNEGFLYPVVDADKCVDCGLCEKVCPELHYALLKQNDYDEPKCYAAQTKNLESLFNSTSGSAFATFAEGMYKLGGYVGGAVFNEDYTISQYISSDKSDLERLRNSKYAQSNSEGFFVAVRDLLKNGEKVLVCGLPCQMAALRSFLGRDYEELIILDLICLGINSPKILHAYLAGLEKKFGSKIVYYKAKNKEFGWRQLTTKIVFANGEVLYDRRDTNPFTHGFIGTHAFSRPSCYACKFKGVPRVADITIGDLWGVESIVDDEYDHDLGTSAILVNSKKGLEFYERVRCNFKEKEIAFADIVKGNFALVESLSKPDIDRRKFYEDLDSMNFDDFARKYIHVPAEYPISRKQKVINVVRFWKSVARVSGFSISTWKNNIVYNFLRKNIKTNIKIGKYVIINKYCIIDISKRSNVTVNGRLIIGKKRVRGSKLETRFLVEDGASLQVSNGEIAYGADIEVFRNASLVLGDGINFNMQATIICAEKILISDNVSFGRNVTIRDNNGGHFISRRTYRDKRPVSIGQHSWICEQSIIMPGAKVGTGVIVGARSLVNGRIPNFSLVTGNPAEVVDQDVSWKL